MCVWLDQSKTLARRSIGATETLFNVPKRDKECGKSAEIRPAKSRSESSGFYDLWDPDWSLNIIMHIGISCKRSYTSIYIYGEEFALKKTSAFRSPVRTEKKTR